MKQTFLKIALAALVTSAALLPIATIAGQPKSFDVEFRSEKIDGLNIAYREAGDPSHPVVLLLHGFPASSQMFRNLIPELAKDYYVIAPDFPGYGASDMPDAATYEYSFANTAALMTKLLDIKGVDKYAVYLMDYGAPVGYRMFAENPERVSGFIIQNGNAYEKGLSEFWDPIKAYWAEPSEENGDKLRGFLTLDATKWIYSHGVQDTSSINPDNFWQIQYLLDRPGNQEVQLEMFLDYGTNVTEYPKWQALFREYQPPALLMWGKNDAIFPEDGARPYKRDLKNLEYHILNTGHFALEEYGDEIAAEMKDFLDRVTN